MVLYAAERFEQRPADEEMEAAHARLDMKPLFPQGEG
jgi:hypothetical protein